MPGTPYNTPLGARNLDPDALSQTVSAVRIVIASVLQLRSIVASQDNELALLRAEIGSLRGLPPLPPRPAFTGFESIPVESGGVCLPQRIPIPVPIHIPTAAAAPAPVTPEGCMSVDTTNTVAAAYSFFATPNPALHSSSSSNDVVPVTPTTSLFSTTVPPDRPRSKPQPQPQPQPVSWAMSPYRRR